MTVDPELLGHLAGLLTTGAFVPQLIRVLRTRQTRDISLVTFILFVLGVALWLVYGLLLQAWPVVAANGATLVLALIILGAKLRYG